MVKLLEVTEERWFLPDPNRTTGLFRAHWRHEDGSTHESEHVYADEEQRAEAWGGLVAWMDGPPALPPLPPPATKPSEIRLNIGLAGWLPIAARVYGPVHVLFGARVADGVLGWLVGKACRVEVVQ